MSSSVVFIESKNDIHLFEKHINQDTIVISMQPSVSVELEQRDIPYQNTLSFFGQECHRYTLVQSTKIVEGVRPFLKKMRAGEVQHAFEKTWIFYFRFYLHYWLAMLCIIDKAVQAYQPDNFIILEPDNVDELVIETIDNDLLSIIVKYYGNAHKINIQYVNKKAYKLSGKVNDVLKGWLGRTIFEFQLFLFPVINRSRNSLFVPEDTYNMPNLLNMVSKYIDRSLPVYLSVRRSSLKTRIQEMLSGESFSFLYLPQGASSGEKLIFQDRINVCTSHIKKWLSGHSNESTIYGVQLQVPLLLFIENNLKQKMLDLYGRINSLQRVMNVVNPKQVFSQHSIGVSYALGEICSYKNIPALLTSHGSHVPHAGDVSELEWSIHAHTIFNSKYPLVAFQTPWAKKFFKQQREVVSQGIDTGPLLFARKNFNDDKRIEFRQKLFTRHKDKKIILHAGTPKGWSSFRPWVYETVDEYIRNINDVIKAVESVADLYLAVRFRPQEGLSLEGFQHSLVISECYDIYADGSFEEHLLASDLLLSYSSTTIEESLQNHIPVLQYDPDGKYEHISGQVLSGRETNNVSTVYSVLSRKDLLPALSWWSENFSEDNQENVSWQEHILDSDNDMKWLAVMEKKEC